MILPLAARLGAPSKWTSPCVTRRPRRRLCPCKTERVRRAPLARAKRVKLCQQVKFRQARLRVRRRLGIRPLLARLRLALRSMPAVMLAHFILLRWILIKPMRMILPMLKPISKGEPQLPNSSRTATCARRFNMCSPRASPVLVSRRSQGLFPPAMRGSLQSRPSAGPSHRI